MCKCVRFWGTEVVLSQNDIGTLVLPPEALYYHLRCYVLNFAKSADMCGITEHSVTRTVSLVRHKSRHWRATLAIVRTKRQGAPGAGSLKILCMTLGHPNSYCIRRPLAFFKLSYGLITTDVPI